MEGLGIPTTATVLTGKYESTVLHSLIVVPSRYCSKWVVRRKMASMRKPFDMVSAFVSSGRFSGPGSRVPLRKLD